MKKLGEVLKEMNVVTEEQLREALEIQKKHGGRIGWILTTLGFVKRYDLFKGLSVHYGLKFATPDLQNLIPKIDVILLKKISRAEILEYQAIPYAAIGNKLIILNSYPKSERTTEFFKNRYSVEFVEEWVITDLDLLETSKKLYGESLMDDSVYGLFYRKPEESAYRVFSFPQFISIIAAIMVFGIVLYFIPNFTLQILLFTCQLLYLIMIGFKFALSIAGSIDEIVFETDNEGINSLKDEELPVYTVLIPVFKEPEVVGMLIDAIKKFDYPQSKLDIILLLEEVDDITLKAAKEAQPPANWRFLVVPKAAPQTKPKACNYGLFFARGKYLVIFDAEDIPEPDQLKKAYLAFQESDESYICFQGALNYFNRDQNLLTKLFTLEYSYWFDYMLPGLFSLKLPIPLGGTSNHFNVEKLRKIGGWDPFNTTEDADLGIRASAENYRVGIIRSTTYEEANSKVWNWIRQRSRWIKGYMQTTLVYNRHPLKMLRTLGLKRFLSFQLFIGGTPLIFLINPVLWGLFLIWIVFNPIFITELFTPLLLYISLFNFLIGNFLGIYMNMLGAFRRNYFKLIPISLLNPFYWLLHSFASYKALWQLLTRPHYWEKTVHGLSNQSNSSNGAESEKSNGGDSK